jgi:hypothetical protein
VVKDWDKIGADEVIAHAYQSLRLIKTRGGAIGPTWINLYGAPLGMSAIASKSSSMKAHMNTFPNQATCYRGRILVSFHIRANEHQIQEENQRVRCHRLPPAMHPETDIYKIRAFVGSGSDIPRLNSAKSGFLANSKMQIVITCGLCELSFERNVNKKGIVTWNQLVESDNLVLPKDVHQIPDIFVYLCKGKVGSTFSRRRNIAFKRYSAKELLSEKMEKEPQWVTLKEDPCVDALKDDCFPGNLFLNLGFGTLVREQTFVIAVTFHRCVFFP